MSVSPLLLLHISGGTIGLLSGAAAVCFRKGSRRHGIAGNVFVISMLTLAASGILLAILKHKTGDTVGGALTLYLVATAWMTARRREERTDPFDWGALLFALGLVTLAATWAIAAATSQTGLKYGYPAGAYIFLGSVALLSTVGDIRMLVRGGVSGTQRLARHLWRMCYALFIASASVFLARPHLFPAFFRTIGLLYVLTLLPLLLMVFWLVRVRFAKTYSAKPMPPRAGEAYSLPT